MEAPKERIPSLVINLIAFCISLVMGNLGVQKKQCSSSSRWALNPKILALILVRIPIEDRVGNVSLVCKNWLACISGPSFLSEIDIQNWCQKRYRSVDQVDSVVRKLMNRSAFSCELLSTYHLGNPGFVCAANFERCLKVLKIPASQVTDKMVEKHAGSLRSLSVLDISYCFSITSKGIEAFGNNCKSLVDLTRNMKLPEIDFEEDDSEAMAIANTMTGLMKLEVCYGSFGKYGMGAILTNCKALKCWNVIVTGDLLDYFIDNEEEEDDDDEEYLYTDSD